MNFYSQENLVGYIRKEWVAYQPTTLVAGEIHQL